MTPLPAPRFRLLSAAALLFTLALAGAGRAGAPAGESWLVWIDVADEDTLADLIDSGLRPVCLAPGFSLLLATAEERRHPSLEHHRTDVLARWRDDSRYYLVYLKGARPGGEPAEALGEVLHRDDTVAVLRIECEREGRLFESYPTARIFDRTLRVRRTAGRAGEAGRPAGVHDPGIQAMVDAVDPARLQARVQELQDHGTRRSDLPGGSAAQEFLVQQLTAMGYADVRTHDYNGYCDNVFAVKPGTVTPERIYAIGGHYDSISNSSYAPGADDNASGTAGVLEAARVLAPYAFESTLYFLAWSGEEQGLEGSQAWCAWAASQGLDIAGYINLDMEGYLADPKDLDVISNGPSSWLRDLAFEAVPMYVPDLPLVNGYIVGGTSDHASFWQRGYDAVFFFEDSDHHSPYLHTTQDVIGVSLNDFTFMKENVQAAVALLAVLASPVHIQIVHTPVPDTPNLVWAYPVTARISGTAPLVPDSLSLRYRLQGGPWIRRPLRPTGASGEYRAYIPGQGMGTTVEYHLLAEDVLGHERASPVAAPAELFTFVAGLTNVLIDSFESDQGWTVGSPTDQATSGIWVRAAPVGTDYQPGADHTVEPGRLCYVTGNGTPGGPAGEADIDGGQTSLVSPVFDLEGAGSAWLSYWSWFVDASNPDDTFTAWLSNDGGGSWTLLERMRPEGTWVRSFFFDLERRLPLTREMRLKFVAEDVLLGSLAEAGLDQVEVRAHFLWGAGVDEATSRMPDLSPDGFSVHPNPGREAFELSFRLSTALPVEIRVFDAAGRSVHSTELGTLAPGPHHYRLETRDASGRALPSGVYFVRLREGSECAPPPSL